jgi:Fe-S-cluster-containing dehydrogenase component
MDKWNLIIDVALCQNCNNCVLAAKDELVGNEFPGYSASHPPHGIGVFRIERCVRGSGHLVDAAYVPMTCNHCDDAPCVKAGAGAIKKRDDGIVMIDPERARGRRDLVDACPFGAIIWNEAEQLPQNWFFDAHLLDQGSKAPRCVGVCPTQAIEATKVTDAEMAERAGREGLRVLRPELGTRPRVHYRNLHRFDRLFVGGSVVRKHGEGVECVGDAQVELSANGQSLHQTTTNAYGDFKFDDIAPATGPVRVSVRHARYGDGVCNAVVNASSVVVGEIVLGPQKPAARNPVL